MSLFGVFKNGCLSTGGRTSLTVYKEELWRKAKKEITKGLKHYFLRCHRPKGGGAGMIMRKPNDSQLQCPPRQRKNIYSLGLPDTPVQLGGKKQHRSASGRIQNNKRRRS